MNTVTHSLVAIACLSKPGETKRNAAVLLGSIIPDAWIFLFYGYNKLIVGHPSEHIWRTLYWQEPWTTLGAIFNSIPLYALIALVGLIAPVTTIAVFGAAALLHVALDFPVHAADAHAHFWPITMWRFQSPLSYWDPDHHGQIVSAVEAVVALGLGAILWQRFKSLAARLVLSGCVAAYLAVPIYFSLSLGQA
ncbi:MAG: hypothetical protein AAFR23_07800 [Pseudomonadota bacterium]